MQTTAPERDSGALLVGPIRISGYKADERRHDLQQTATERHEERDKAYWDQKIQSQDCSPAGWRKQLVCNLANNRHQWLMRRKNEENVAAQSCEKSLQGGASDD
jgi:hypothetical protein